MSHLWKGVEFDKPKPNETAEQRNFGAELRSWVMIMCTFLTMRIIMSTTSDIQDINSNSLQKTIYLSPRG